MKVLVLGSGAREHALSWKFAQSNRISGLFIAPGNAGTEAHGENLPGIDPNDAEQVSKICKNRQIDLVFIGPEEPLARGIADVLKSEGIQVIGPGKEAAQLEASKAFSKSFMRRHKVPTADYREFDNSKTFEKYLGRKKGPLVIKKSGLAAGKGVLESSDKDEMVTFGNKILANDLLLVEDFLQGWEISVFAATDGIDYRLLPTCADFKKAGEHDSGANTGGMGAICPVPIVSADLLANIDQKIVRPTFDGMKAEGLSYRGVLYFGLMITESGPKLLEYNVRFGDPETQVLLPLIKSDFVNLCEAMLNGSLASFPLAISTESAVGVVVASGGYPASYKKNVRVDSLPGFSDKHLLVFHANTKRDDNGNVFTEGGRCFTVVGVGPTILGANHRAYETVPKIRFEGAWARPDIGQKFFMQE